MERLGDYLTSPFVVRAYIAVLIVAVNAGIAGSFASFRNSTFLIAGASHAALAGAAAVILLVTSGIISDIDPMIGGAVTAVMLSLMAGHVNYTGRSGETDTAIGVGFAFSMAIAVLLISVIPESASRVWAILMGDLLLVTWDDLVLMGFATAIIAALFLIFFRQFIFITFDMEGAKAFGINAYWYNFLMFGLIGMSSALLLKGIGAILVFAMMVAPSATAMLVAGSVRRIITGAFLIAVGSGLAGILVSYFIDVSVTALTATFATGAYVVVRIWVHLAGRSSN